MAPIGKALIALGAAIAALGLALWALSSVPYVERLPGDFYVRGKSFSCYFPLTAGILISIAASLGFAILRRLL